MRDYPEQLTTQLDPAKFPLHALVRFEKARHISEGRTQVQTFARKVKAADDPADHVQAVITASLGLRKEIEVAMLRDDAEGAEGSATSPRLLRGLQDYAWPRLEGGPLTPMMLDKAIATYVSKRLKTRVTEADFHHLGYPLHLHNGALLAGKGLIDYIVETFDHVVEVDGEHYYRGLKLVGHPFALADRALLLDPSEMTRASVRPMHENTYWGEAGKVSYIITDVRLDVRPTAVIVLLANLRLPFTALIEGADMIDTAPHGQVIV